MTAPFNVLTCNRGSKCIDLILGDAFIRKAVIEADHLKKTKVSSDHTMQWVDLNIKDLFQSEQVVPSARAKYKIVCANKHYVHKKKHAFQEKFEKLNAYHKVEAKINKLEADFESLSETGLNGDEGKRLIARYQTIDRVIADNMKCAANSVKCSEREYEFSNKVVISSNRVKLWEEVLSQTQRHKPFKRHILRLAEKISYKFYVQLDWPWIAEGAYTGIFAVAVQFQNKDQFWISC